MEENSKSVRVNISLPIDFLKKVDIRTKQERRNRSEVIRESLKRYLKTPIKI